MTIFKQLALAALLVAWASPAAALDTVMSCPRGKICIEPK